MDLELEKAEGPEEALFAVCVHPLLALVPDSALLWMKVHISASEAEIRQAALGEEGRGKRGHGVDVVVRVQTRCQRARTCTQRGEEMPRTRSGEQLWLL